jgi:hypothetical protein
VEILYQKQQGGQGMQKRAQLYTIDRYRDIEDVDKVDIEKRVFYYFSYPIL